MINYYIEIAFLAVNILTSAQTIITSLKSYGNLYVPYYKQNMTHKNYLKFRCQMVNMGKRELCSKATTAMRDAAMMLLLRRLPRNAVTFCTSEKVRETMLVETWCR
jgi:hypothetical protein